MRILKYRKRRCQGEEYNEEGKRKEKGGKECRRRERRRERECVEKK